MRQKHKLSSVCSINNNYYSQHVVTGCVLAIVVLYVVDIALLMMYACMHACTNSLQHNNLILHVKGSEDTYMCMCIHACMHARREGGGEHHLIYLAAGLSCWIQASENEDSPSPLSSCSSSLLHDEMFFKKLLLVVVAGSLSLPSCRVY